MPTAHGFAVHVVTANGQKFTEYGHQTLRASGTPSTSKTVSTKIQAKDGETFCIQVDVKNPIPYHEKKKKDTVALTALNGEELGMIGNGSSINRYNLRSSLKQLRGHDGFNKEERTQPSIDRGKKAKPRQLSVSNEKPPFVMVAWVFVDGNKVPECSQILYTEPGRSPFLLRGRYTAAPVSKGGMTGGPEQDIVIQDWVFTPVGIDVLLSKMNIAAPDPEPFANAVDEELDEVIKGLAEVNAPKRDKSGQIEVRITRIVYVKDMPLSDWRRKERLEQQAQEDAEATHTISISEPQRRMRVKTCAWRPYDETEEYYAKFIFQCMGLEKLVNLGLCTADGKPTKQRHPKAGTGPFLWPASAGVGPLKPLKRSNIKSGGRPWSGDEEGQDWVDTSSSDDSDPPRKRHEAVTTYPKPRHFGKRSGHHKKPSNMRGPSDSLSLLPKPRQDDAGQGQMQLVIRPGRNGGGGEDQGSKLELVEPGQSKEDRVEGSRLAWVKVEAEAGGEDKTE